MNLPPEVAQAVARSYDRGWLQPPTEPPLNLNAFYRKPRAGSVKFAAQTAKRLAWLSAHPGKSYQDWKKVLRREWKRGRKS